jgi:hypothetical protein
MTTLLAAFSTQQPGPGGGSGRQLECREELRFLAENVAPSE